MQNTALVTGASSGIGMELATEHARHGGDLVLVARREDRLQELKAKIEAEHKVSVEVITADLSKLSAAEHLYQNIKDKNIQVDILINNAGFGGYGKFHEREMQLEEDMVLLNIMTLMKLTKLFLKEMVARDSGRIVNVASVAGFIPGPLQAVYYATKSFVQSLTTAIASEIEETNVSLTILCPGPTHSEFGKVAKVENIRAFRSQFMKTMTSKEVAKFGYKAMLDGRLFATPGMSNKFLVHFISKFMPRFTQAKVTKYLQEAA